MRGFSPIGTGWKKNDKTKGQKSCASQGGGKNAYKIQMLNDM
jgi:hypothetical protein